MISAAAFDVNAAFPADPKCRPMVEAMVSQAAECAGCDAEMAKAFAEEVGTVFAERATKKAGSGEVAVRVARSADTIEVAVTAGDTVRVTRAAPHVAPAS